MRRLKNIYPVIQIRHKIIICIYLLIFSVLLIAEGLIYFWNYRDSVREKKHQYQSAVQSLSDNLWYYERDLLDISTYFAVNMDIQRLLSQNTQETTPNPLVWEKLAPMGVITDILAIKSHIKTLILYPENGLPPYSCSRDTNVLNEDINEIRKLPIYKTAIEARGDNILVRVNTADTGLYLKNKSDKILICRELFDMRKEKRLAFLALGMNIDLYEEACQKALFFDNEAIVIFNAKGQEIVRVGQVNEEALSYIQSKEALSAQTEGFPLLYDDCYIFTSVNETDNKFYYFSPKSNWDEWMRTGLWVPVILAIVLLICMWPISAFASSIISRPLDKLYSSMNKFKEGDFNQQIEVTGRDEISEVVRTFNKMVSELKELIDRNYVMVLREKESELNALQAQINPHFLYNTLDSLYWQAVNCEQEKLAEDIISLSELFRLTLSSGQSEIPVRKEIDIIKYYLRIQKMRFEVKLDDFIDVDAAIYEYRIPKLILQPFVENAIVHGLESRDSWGYVKVSGHLEDDMMIFTIEDNGKGMSAEKIDEILTGSEEKRYASQRIGHYAIGNVNERISLRYNGKGKLEIESKVGEGSTVRISIPLC